MLAIVHDAAHAVGKVLWPTCIDEHRRVAEACLDRRQPVCDDRSAARRGLDRSETEALLKRREDGNGRPVVESHKFVIRDEPGQCDPRCHRRCLDLGGEQFAGRQERVVERTDENELEARIRLRH